MHDLLTRTRKCAEYTLRGASSGVVFLLLVYST